MGILDHAQADPMKCAHAPLFLEQKSLLGHWRYPVGQSVEFSCRFCRKKWQEYQAKDLQEAESKQKFLDGSEVRGLSFENRYIMNNELLIRGMNDAFDGRGHHLLSLAIIKTSISGY